MEVGNILHLGKGHKTFPVEHGGLFHVTLQREFPEVAGDGRLHAQIQDGPVLDLMLTGRQLGHAMTIGRAAALDLPIGGAAAGEQTFLRDPDLAADPGLIELVGFFHRSSRGDEGWFRFVPVK